MSITDGITAELLSIEEMNWERANASHGGRPQARVRDLLHAHPELSITDARIKALSEMGMNTLKIALLLGLEEKTVYNHQSRIRKLAGAPRSVSFRNVFFPLPEVKTPPETEEKNDEK